MNPAPLRRLRPAASHSGATLDLDGPGIGAASGGRRAGAEVCDDAGIGPTRPREAP